MKTVQIWPLSWPQLPLGCHPSLLGVGEDGGHQGGGAGQEDQGDEGGISGWRTLNNLVRGSFPQDKRISKTLSKMSFVGGVFPTIPRWKQIIEGPKTLELISRKKPPGGGSFLVRKSPPFHHGCTKFPPFYHGLKDLGMQQGWMVGIKEALVKHRALQSGIC